MQKDLTEVTYQIDKEFINFFQDDVSVKTIFVAGSMAHDDYQDRQDNDYDIRVISSKVTKEKLIQFEKFLQELSKKLTTDNLAVGYSCLVGPVNHKVSYEKKNILIHAMIHQTDQMDDFLPITHKYQYGTRYRIVYGEDSLKRFQDIEYDVSDVLNCHEGLRYCIDMLKKREYRYLTWDIKEDGCEFNFHTIPMDDDVVLENCFYSFNKFITNLMNCCHFQNYDIPLDKMVFTIRLLGAKNCDENTLFLLHSLFTKSEVMMKKLFTNPVNETIFLLESLEERALKLDLIFEQNEIIKTKKLTI